MTLSWCYAHIYDLVTDCTLAEHYSPPLQYDESRLVRCCSDLHAACRFAPRRRGPLGDTAIRPSVCPSLGYRHAGCLQLAGHQRCVDRVSAASRTAIGGGISSRRPRGDTTLPLSVCLHRPTDHTTTVSLSVCLMMHVRESPDIF